MTFFFAHQDHVSSRACTKYVPLTCMRRIRRNFMHARNTSQSHAFTGNGIHLPSSFPDIVCMLVSMRLRITFLTYAVLSVGSYTPGGATPAPASSKVARTPMRQTSILDEAKAVAAMQRLANPLAGGESHRAEIEGMQCVEYLPSAC